MFKQEANNMEEEKKLYELAAIFMPDIEESTLVNHIENVRNLISNSGGELIGTDTWGMREMAYPIKKRTSGYYVIFYFRGNPSAPHKIRDILRIDENVIRHLIVVNQNMPALDKVGDKDGAK